MANVVVWADIPVIDLERARKFYAHLLGTPVEDMPGVPGVAILKSPGATEPMDVSADLAVGPIMPSNIRMVVVLPAPFRPRNA